MASLARTGAIAALTLRGIVRSRPLIALLTALAAVVIALPLAIKGDGTVSGDIRVTLSYALSAAGILLGAATLWISCALVSQDIEEKRMCLVAVKPVKPCEIWLGRWLGVLALNAVLLLGCGATVSAIVRMKTSPDKLAPADRRQLFEQVLVGRRRITPEQPNVMEEARQRLAQWRAAGAIPGDTQDEEVLDLIRQRLIAEQAIVPPGHAKVWSLPIASPPPEGAPVWLRFHLQSPDRTASPASGTWTVGPDRAADRPVVIPMRDHVAGMHLVPIPAAALRDVKMLQVRFVNAPADASHTLFFPPAQAPEILVRESGFEMNLARALLVLWCHLAALSALGLTAGSLFSYPVAGFVAVSIVVATLLSHFFMFTLSPEHAESHTHDHHGVPLQPSLLEKAGEVMILRTRAVAEPAVRLDVLRQLSDGILVSWRATGATVLVLVCVYSGIGGILGGMILRRRELALPAD